MIEQMVVGIDGSNASFEAFEQALRLAKRVSCAIKCVFVVDSRKTQVPIVYTGSSFDISLERIYLPLDPNLKQYYTKIADDLHSFAKNCMDICTERCETSKVPFQYAIREGYPTAELCAECRSGDVLVIGQRGENAQYRRTIVGSTTEDMVRTSPRPIIMVPKLRPDIRRVLYVFDGSRTASNALRFYVNTMPTLADDFVLLEVEESEVPGSVEEESDYLRHHGIPFRVIRRVDVPNLSVMDVAAREESDLILTGAYGKHKIKDFILGTTTAHLLRRSTLPVFIVY